MKFRAYKKSINDHVDIGEHDSLEKALSRLAKHIADYVANGNYGHALTIENSRACLRLNTSSNDYFDEDDRFMKREFIRDVYEGLKSNYDFSESCNVELGRWKYDISRREV